MLKDKVLKFTVANDIRNIGLYPYFRIIESEQDTVVKIDGKDVLMFGSNSYLGLTNHPKLKERSKQAIDKYGSGCAGSRFLNGTLDLHIELEDRLAKLVGKEKALVFSTGYQVNIGVISALMGRNDVIILDELDHACILDGARLSLARKYKYKHNDMASLEKLLKRTQDAESRLIVVDGVFSMEGDICKLDEIVELSKKYNANIMVDDAHGIGVIGRNGRGTCDHFGLTDDVDFIMGTFSKSLASIGGFIASDAVFIDFIKHHARSLIFSASIAPGNAGSVLASLDIMENEPERMENLHRNTTYALKRFNEIGFDTGLSETAIIPIFIRDNLKTFTLTSKLLERGVFINPVVSPAVAENDTLIRFSLMANHTIEQIEKAISTIQEIAIELGILSLQEQTV